MTIKIHDNKIEFISPAGRVFTLVEGEGSFTFNGRIYAETINSYMQGDIAGFSIGGQTPTVKLNTVDRYSFTNDSNATSHGNVFEPETTLGLLTNSSTVTSKWNSRAYVIGGQSPTVASVAYNYSFSLVSNASSASSPKFSPSRSIAAATTSSTGSYGYLVGGYRTPPAVYYNTITRIPFAAGEFHSDVGVLVRQSALSAPAQSENYGYTIASTAPTNPGTFNTIEKYPFASTSNGTEVGTLINNYSNRAGTSSFTHGYVSGGRTSTTTSYNVIEKIQFSSDSNSSDVGDLLVAGSEAFGTSSTTHGYSHGSRTWPGGANTNTIQKFPFSVDTNASDVGDLINRVDSNTGTQF